MHKDTKLTTLGCAPDEHRGAVNTPVYRASTILFPNLSAFEAAERGESPHPSYGRYGTVSTDALEGAIAELEGTDHAIVTASGMSAITVSLMSFLRSGDHLLMVDTTYGPARRLCDHELKRFGVETTYYDPLVGAGIAELMRDNTKVVYLESPGSLTFEVQDIPAICEAAHARGAVVISDNTWATPMYMNPLELGIDISLHSATKYISGHSDLIMGTLACNEPHYTPLLRTFRSIGACPSGDNCYLALRGLRSMGARLRVHQESAMKAADWLKKHPLVSEVLYPALPGAPGHDLWKRDFTGATGLFSFILKKPAGHAALSAMLDNMELFGMGYSWGGFESLIIPISPQKTRTATQWARKGQGLRVHIGLENVDDLIADLEAGLSRLQKAS